MSASPDSPHGDIAFVSLLRACAVLLVVYCHLIGGFLAYSRMQWPPADVVAAFVTRPFAITQSFGFLGVALFFLISGFIITHVGLRESRREFAVKRLLRIYPPLIASLVVVIVTERLAGHALLPLTSYALGATLLNYAAYPLIEVNPVAWSLAVEMIFYTLVVVGLTWMKRRPVTTCAGLTTFCLAVMLTSRAFGPSYYLFAVMVTYVPYLLAGQAVYFLWSGRISRAQFAALTAYDFFAVALGLQTVHERFYDANDSYGVSFLYAYLVFALCTLVARRITVPAPLKYVARISYSLYLVHFAVGNIVLLPLARQLGYSLALAVALIAVWVVATLMYSFVEAPSQRFARWLLRRSSSAAEAAPPVAVAAGA